MILDHENKFIFVAVAKTACTSIHRRFGFPPQSDPVPSIFHMHLEDIVKNNPESKDYYKFGFVRNPYERLVSAYYNFTSMVRGTVSPGWEWAQPIGKYKTFKHFVENLENSECINFIHLQKQYDFLKLNGKIGVDFVGKYENLNEDFKKIENHLGLESKKLPTTRQSSHPHYSSLYDEGMKKIVQKLYHEDFEEFDYEK